VNQDSQAQAVAREIGTLLRECGGDPALQDMMRTWVFDSKRKGPEQRESPWPFITLYVCEAICGAWEHAVPAAAAIELFVAAADLLDDIEDGDYDFLLKHQYSIAQANNAVVALLMLGQKAVTLLRREKVPADTVVSVMQSLVSSGLVACGGQHAEFDRRGADLSEEDYMRLIEMKSGALTECACQVGALLATDDGRVIDSYALFGKRIGLAGQLANDARSIANSRIGQSDIARKKRTLPIIYGLKQAQGADATFLKSIFAGPDEVTPEAESEVRRILMALGAVQYTLVLAQIERQKALEALQTSGISIGANKKLLSLVGLTGGHTDGD